MNNPTHINTMGVQGASEVHWCVQSAQGAQALRIVKPVSLDSDLSTHKLYALIKILC